MTCYVNLINKRCLNSNVMDVKFISHNKMLSRYKLLWINNHFVTCLLFTTLHLITSSMRNSILIPGMRSGLDSRWRALPCHPPPVTSTSSNWQQISSSAGLQSSENIVNLLKYYHLKYDHSTDQSYFQSGRICSAAVSLLSWTLACTNLDTSQSLQAICSCRNF